MTFSSRRLVRVAVAASPRSPASSYASRPGTLRAHGRRFPRGAHAFEARRPRRLDALAPAVFRPAARALRRLLAAEARPPLGHARRRARLLGPLARHAAHRSPARRVAEDRRAAPRLERSRSTIRRRRARTPSSRASPPSTAPARGQRGAGGGAAALVHGPGHTRRLRARVRGADRQRRDHAGRPARAVPAGGRGGQRQLAQSIAPTARHRPASTPANSCVSTRPGTGPGQGRFRVEAAGRARARALRAGARCAKRRYDVRAAWEKAAREPARGRPPLWQRRLAYHAARQLRRLPTTGTARPTAPR